MKSLLSLLKNVPLESITPLKAFLKDVSIRTDWLNTSSLTKRFSSSVETAELHEIQHKQQAVKELLCTIKNRVNEGTLIPSVDDVTVIHQIANKVFDATNTLSTPHLIDLDVYFQLNEILTTSIVEHYSIGVLGAAFFLQHYTVINLFSKDIFHVVVQRKLEAYYIDQALHLKVSIPKVLIFSASTVAVSALFLVNPDLLLHFKYGAVPFDCFTYGRAIGGAVSTFTKGLFFDASDPGTWFGKTLSKIIKGFLKK